VRQRPLGRTGLNVSELALGTWGLSGEAYGAVEEKEARRVVDRSVELGISLFDTADAYGGGRMEALLGEALLLRKDARIVTRAGIDRTTTPPHRNFSALYLRGAVERSLRRLRRSAIDIFLLHSPSIDALAAEETVKVMGDLKKEGKIVTWGVSVGDADHAHYAIDRGAEVISLAYNLLHCIDLHRIMGDVMVQGTGVLVHSVLAHGLLADSWTKETSFEEGDHRRERWLRPEFERKIDHLDAVRFLAHGHVSTLRGAAVRYALANHVVSTAILGPKSTQQLDALVRETGGGPTYLPDKDLAALPRALSRLGIPT